MLQATTYKSISAIQRRDGSKLIFSITGSIPESAQALDLGCGTGNLTSMLAEHVGPKGSVLGIDPDSERIKIARKTYCAENLKFAEANSDNFPADAEQYDIVFSNYVIHWIKDKQAVFKRIYSSLKPGGIFCFISVANHHRYLDELQNMMCPKQRALVYNSLHFEPEERYCHYAETAKFSIESKKSFATAGEFDSVDGLIDFWFAVTHGAFDPNEADQTELNKFKRQFGNSPVTLTGLANVVLMILRK